MYKFILTQWKNRKATVALIITGFFVGCLVMSIGISACVESFEYIGDRKCGDPKQQLEIFLSADESWGQNEVEKIIETVGQYGEVQLLSMDSKKLDDYDEYYPCVPVLFEQEPGWHIPLVKGRYFTKTDMNGSNRVMIIGKNIAENNGINLGDMVSIEGEQFEVVGICGRSTRETSWEYAIYMPWQEYIQIYKNCFQERETSNTISIHLESGKSDYLNNSDTFVTQANQNGINIVYKDVENVDSSSLNNTIIITVTATILIFIIAILNIVHLMLYWILERKKEIGIMKALGASNNYIARAVIWEVLAMAIFGSVLAVGVQFTVIKLLSDNMLGEMITLRMTWLNLIGSMGVSLFFGMIAAIFPAKNVMRLEPLQIINNE